MISKKEGYTFRPFPNYDKHNYIEEDLGKAKKITYPFKCK